MPYANTGGYQRPFGRGGGVGYTGSYSVAPGSAQGSGSYGGVGFRNAFPVAPGSAQGAANSPAQAAALGQAFGGPNGYEATMQKTNRARNQGYNFTTRTYGGTQPPQASNTPRFGLSRQFGRKYKGGFTPGNIPVGTAIQPQVSNTPQFDQFGQFGQQQNGGFPPGNLPVGTTIQPQTMFSSDQSQQMINMLAAQQFTNADPNHLMKQFMRPGASRDAGTMSLAAPQIAAAGANVRGIQAGQPMLDQLINQRFLLQGQQAQGQEGLGLAELLRGGQRIDDYRQTQMISPLLRSLLGY